MSNKQDSNIPWWLIVLGFIFFWPVGMVLLFMNLGGVNIPTDQIRRDMKDRYGSSAGAGPYAPSGAADWQAQNGQARRQTPPASSTSARGMGAPRNDPGRVRQRSGLHRGFRSPRGGTALTVVGTIFSLCFAVSCFGVIAGTGLSGARAITGAFTTFGFLCASLFMTGMGLSMTRRARRQRLYLGLIGQRSSIFISDLAGAAGVPEKKAIADLQRMLSDGILPMGYIDRATGRLVLTDQGYEPPQDWVKQAEGGKKSASSDDAILREIKAINDAIPDEEMSRKIDRIGEITGKILDYQRQNPAKAGQLRQFLNYYLPTTLKILKAYAQMDAQGVQGSNISAAKARIEGMMDKVVEGFEKQLDQLFQTEAMDITADVAVLERMLDSDGLGSGMTFS